MLANWLIYLAKTTLNTVTDKWIIEILKDKYPKSKKALIKWQWNEAKMK